MTALILSLNLGGALQITGVQTYDRANGGILRMPTVADATARLALTGMQVDEIVMQRDTNDFYRWTGSAWALVTEAGGGGGGGGPDVSIVDTSASAQSVALPTLPAAGVRRIVMDGSGNAEANPITIVPDGSDTIDGEASDFIFHDGGIVTLISDGTKWLVESRSSLAFVDSAVAGAWAAANHYRGAVGAMVGDAGGFSVEALVSFQEDPFNPVFINAGDGARGFQLGIDGNQVRFACYDTNGLFVDAITEIQGIRGPKELGAGPHHLVGTLQSHGAFFTCSIYLNGVRLVGQDNFAAQAPYQPASAADRLTIGYSPRGGGSQAAGQAILGCGYDENQWTDAQIRRRYELIRRAGRLVDGEIHPDHLWVGRDNPDVGATWSDRGSATPSADLELVGALSAQRVLFSR